MNEERIKVSKDLLSDGLGLVAAAGYINNEGGQAIADAANDLMGQGCKTLLIDLDGTRIINSIGVSILLEILEKLMDEKKIFEYWSHAAAYLPTRDYRFSLFRKHAIKSGKENHWYTRDEKLIKSVLRRIGAEGPVMAKDLETKGKRPGEWQSGPYLIRLTVVDDTANEVGQCVIQITLDNG